MRKSRGMSASLCVACLFIVSMATSRLAEAAEAGVLTGTVQGPDGVPIAGVTVRLANTVTGFSASSVTTNDGRFEFFNVPFNPYVVAIDLQGFKPWRRDVDVRSSLRVTLLCKLELETFKESVTVTAEQSPVQLETDTSTSHVDIDKSYITRAPATVASRAMEEIITATPGFAKDENGRFHFQGAHSQSEYVIDGQTVSDQTGATFSNSIDPGIAQAIEVIYGNVPAEFGEKMGAVINLTTKSGLGSGPLHGEVYGGAARYATYEGGADLGYGTEQFGLFASLDGSKSERFLDPVNFSNLHNTGNTERAFFRGDWAPDSSDTYRFTALVGRTDRDVPNTYTQQAAGQDQRVRTRDANVNLGWQRILGADTVLDVTLYGRNSSYDLDPSAGDTPVRAVSRRSLDNYGASPSLTLLVGVHEIKVGGTFKRIPIDERFGFGLTDPSLNDPTSPDFNPDLAPYDLTRGGTMFDFSASRTGTYWALFAQDNMRLGDLTANLGVRYDHNNLPVSESQLEPRIGLAYYVPSSHTVLRASYNRVFYTPEYENILFSSSQAAADLTPPVIQTSRALGGGRLLVRSERQNAYTVGVQQAIGKKLRLDVDAWDRRSTYAGDQDQFLNTGIVFPLAFASGRLHGWDLRLDLAETHGLRGFLSLGHTRAIYVAPPVGGLFLDAEALDALAGGPFVIDHDQNLQLQAGLVYSIARTGAWVGGNVRYDSGLVTDVSPGDLVGDPDNAFAIPYVRVNSGTWRDPNRVAGRTIWDFSLGYDLKRADLPISFQVDVLNAFDTRGVYNILSVFGGTHVIPPRTIAGRVRVRI
jgi:Carboxypeptidase regulatory-like domain